uniref:NADH-ubiquinone oxidoreductase chain 2 n=1 Tax=Berghia stephanieae TaxID=1287507 RepID=A0A7S7Z951_9GAST|nr:NADH dehydrogenase subunit 2 [Berghia stephanieae]
MSSGNFLFYLMMLSGPVVALSSSNWLVCWVGIELSFIGLIPIILSDNSGLSTSSECGLKYFCIQAAGSGVLLLGGIMKFMMPLDFSVAEYIFLAGLVLKLGVFPFHFWVPGVVSGLNWVSMFLVLTWQKLSPFLFLMNLLENSPWLSSGIIILGGFSAIVGATIGLNQTMVGPLLGASSITHTGWIVLGAVWGNFWTYYIIYVICLFFLFVFLHNKEDFFSGFVFLSLSGLPPFFMFVAKWSIIKSVLCVGESVWFLLLPLLGSIMSLFFYLKLFYSFYLESSRSMSIKMATLSFGGVVSMLGTGFILGF